MKVGVEMVRRLIQRSQVGVEIVRRLIQRSLMEILVDRVWKVGKAWKHTPHIGTTPNVRTPAAAEPGPNQAYLSWSPDP